MLQLLISGDYQISDYEDIGSLSDNGIYFIKELKTITRQQDNTTTI